MSFFHLYSTWVLLIDGGLWDGLRRTPRLRFIRTKLGKR